LKTQAFNPYLPSWEYIPDGEPYVFGDRVYVYGSHDQFDGKSFCLGDYVCWSAPTTDLSDWRFEGTIFEATQDPKNPNREGALFAPDVAKGTDGKYYLYYALSNQNVTSVAVSDTPAGKYEFLGYIKDANGTPAGEAEPRYRQFDPGVLVDDDGKVYFATGFSPRDKSHFDKSGILCMGAYLFELEPDMLTIKRGGDIVAPSVHNSKGTGFEGHEFFEASSLRKVGEKYYFVYSSINSHELCYAVSDYPDRGYKFGGTIVSNADIPLHGENVFANYGGNTHGSIVEIEGQWYVFYHRQTNLHQYSRQACAERIRIQPDGSIPQSEITSCGLNGKPLQAKGRYESRIACNLSSDKGADFYSLSKMPSEGRPYFTQTTPDGNYQEGESAQYIANMHNNYWCGFKYFSFGGDESKITASARGSGTGKLVVSTKRGEDVLSEISVSPSKDISSSSAPLNVSQGVYPLYFTYVGDGAIDFFDFTIA
jgi:hypothetical protein